ncbi:acyl carrier protein [Noviherbaspirillum denitrificans]|uniref:Carrier domain-containing protein n=1 Tax=Noviherbaspirillum denitrificans TaxID=1968433 RepID=A0A254TCN2_9BURK|nr:acyl carrier protein [Noviherbaspirillum denitrificans]OWW20315.1 hypothetical protein AYR66_13240 [Noviherbaspirillum denitrificans]
MDIRTTLADIAVKEFKCDPDKLSDDTPITELGIDSIGMLEFIFRVEEVFDIHVENAQAENLRTLRDFTELVGQLTTAVQ